MDEDRDSSAVGRRRNDATAAHNSALALISLGELKATVDANHQRFLEHIKDDHKGFEDVKAAFADSQKERGNMAAALEANTKTTNEISDAIKPLRTFQSVKGKVKVFVLTALTLAAAGSIEKGVQAFFARISSPTPAVSAQIPPAVKP